MSRDKLRSVAVGNKAIQNSKIVTWKGVEYEIKQMTIKTRDKISQKSMTDGVIDSFKFSIYWIIESIYVPNTDIRVFEDEDYEFLSNDMTNGIVDYLSEHIDNFITNDTVLEKKKS